MMTAVILIYAIGVTVTWFLVSEAPEADYPD